jgi:hypothetical protein
LGRRQLIPGAKKRPELEEQSVNIQREMAVLPRAGGVCGEPAWQGRMRGRDDHDWGGVIEERVIAQGDSDFDTRQFLEALIEEKHVVATTARVLERLLS